MEGRTEDLVEALRQARARKGWSQRDLSLRAGLTQAHLSRIESGAVDLKLSTFLQLARLLDLEPILAPRTALPAVHALIGEADADRQARALRGAANLLQQRVGLLRLDHPKDPLVERLGELVADLGALAPRLRTPAELAELLEITDQLKAVGSRPGRGLTGLRRSVERLAQLRNSLAPAQHEAQRPAYSLDDED